MKGKSFATVWRKLPPLFGCILIHFFVIFTDASQKQELWACTQHLVGVRFIVLSWGLQWVIWQPLSLHDCTNFKLRLSRNSFNRPPWPNTSTIKTLKYAVRCFTGANFNSYMAFKRWLRSQRYDIVWIIFLHDLGNEVHMIFKSKPILPFDRRVWSFQ